MSVTNEHPELTADIKYQWRLMRDADAGNTRIHSHDARVTDSQSIRQRDGRQANTIGLLWDTYLPVPGGFLSNWANGGQQMWAAYLRRAQFPEIIAPAVNSMTGIIHKNEWQVELPAGMEYLADAASYDGAPLETFAERLTRELLLVGRAAIGVDVSVEGGDPYLVCHKAETLINWDENFFVFNESGMERNGYDWTEVVRYRVHELDGGRYVQRLLDSQGELLGEVVPQGRGGPLNYVPIVVAGARDITQNIEEPPLIGAADGAVAVYRLDADYRHQLYMSGQETLVVDNTDAPSAVGPAVALEINSTSDNPASVYYVSPTCKGIEAHEKAIERGWETAARAGAKLFDSGSAQESGEARRMRQNAESATLQTVANTAAAALEMSLKNVARMVGADPEAVAVTPPRNLLDAPMSSQDVVNMVKAWREGGFSYQTLYENLQRGQIASNERDADEELSGMNIEIDGADGSEL